MSGLRTKQVKLSKGIMEMPKDIYKLAKKRSIQPISIPKGEAMSNLSPEDRLTRARVQLLANRPFFGRLAMRLLMCESNQLDTTATDGTYLYWNRKFISEIVDKDVEFCFEHEIMHIVQNAFDRKPAGADHLVWNLACDYVINTLILDGGMTNSPLLTMLCTIEVQGMARNQTSEQVYRKLLSKMPKCQACEQGIPLPQPQSPDEQSGAGEQEGGSEQPGEGEGDGHDHKDGKGCGSNGQPKHTCNPKGCCSGTLGHKKMSDHEKAQWKQAIVAAAEAARSQGKLPGHLQDMIGKLLEPTVSWKDIVRYSAAKAFRGRWTWYRKSRRQGDFPLRRIAREPNPKGAVIMLDTSGSISDNELRQFVSESVEIMRVCKAPWIDIYLHDTHCYKVWRITKGVGDDKWEVQRGGTSHIDVFKKCLEQNEKPGLIIAFTDLATDFPPEQPACEVIWAHPKGYGENASIPWGRKVEVDLSES